MHSAMSEVVKQTILMCLIDPILTLYYILCCNTRKVMNILCQEIQQQCELV